MENSISKKTGVLQGKLTDFLKAKGAKSAVIVLGPKGAFISVTNTDNSKYTMPVGKRSQNGKLADFNVLVTEEGVAIATINDYKEVDSMVF